MSDPRLMPCPFCSEKEGKENGPMFLRFKKKGFDREHVTVQCTNCGCEPDNCVETEEEAMDFWNTRRLLADTDQAIVGFNCAKERIIDMIKILHVKKLEK
jgi:hypothetical protein